MARTKDKREQVRRRALLEWRRLPEAVDPSRHQQHAGAVATALMDRLGLTQRLREEELAATWSRIVGEFSARHSHPARLKHRVLFVAVTQPSILWTLDRSKATILARLQARFGPDVIAQIRFQAG
jgi:predicted nucleic acid-binding Zn ribbon protein